MPDFVHETAHVAGFRFLWRTYITLVGGEAMYRIQTTVGERCSLRYTAPDGTHWPASGEPAVVTAFCQAPFCPASLACSAFHDQLTNQLDL